MLGAVPTPMRTRIHPVRSEDHRAAGGSDDIEARKAQIRGEPSPWYIGRSSGDDQDPMAGLNGSRVDLTRVLRGKRLKR